MSRNIRQFLNFLLNRLRNVKCQDTTPTSDNPRPVGVKKLGDQEEYRLRISDYRVLYTIDDRKKIIEIVSVGHRKVAYR